MDDIIQYLTHIKEQISQKFANYYTNDKINKEVVQFIEKNIDESLSSIISDIKDISEKPVDQSVDESVEQSVEQPVEQPVEEEVNYSFCAKLQLNNLAHFEEFIKSFKKILKKISNLPEPEIMEDTTMDYFEFNSREDLEFFIKEMSSYYIVYWRYDDRWRWFNYGTIDEFIKEVCE